MARSLTDEKGVGHENRGQRAGGKDQRGQQACITALGGRLRICGPGTLSLLECNSSPLQGPRHRAGFHSPTPTPGGRIRLQASYSAPMYAERQAQPGAHRR